MNPKRARVLTKRFCHVEALDDAKGNVIVDKNGEPQLKMLNPRVELLYTYLVTWHVMHQLSLMSVVQTSEDFVPFEQKLEHSSWQGLYMYMIQSTSRIV